VSYDLFLKPRSGEFSPERFLEYFEGRPSYVVQGQQAWYQNEDTGVYFSFETHPPQAAGEDDDSAVGYPVSFNMNYFRPSFFALEAEPELSRVVGEFDFVVQDPQADGMGEGEFVSSRFLSGWKKGNEFGYQAILRVPQGRPDVVSMPAGKLERIWNWNYERAKLQHELGESIFVPRIMFFKDGGSVISAAVWGDGIPTAFPSEVDALVVYLKELAPRRWFRRKDTIATVAWDSVRPLVERFTRSHRDGMISQYSTPPKDIVEFLQSLPPRAQMLEGVSADAVLDAELVARYAA
jgi:hypothetical protein